MSAAMTVWVIGYLFTLGAIPDDPKLPAYKGILLFLLLMIVWPFVLGVVWRTKK